MCLAASERKGLKERPKEGPTVGQRMEGEMMFSLTKTSGHVELLCPGQRKESEKRLLEAYYVSKKKSPHLEPDIG